MNAEEKLKQPRPFPQFKEGEKVRVSPNFTIIMGYKGGTRPEDNERRFFITPLNDVAQRMLESAAQLHHIPTERRIVEEEGQTKERLCIRMDFSEENWEDSICGDRLIIPDKESSDTVPPIARMEELIGKGTDIYSFED